MYDQSFNSASLARMLRKSDFVTYPSLRDPAHRASILASAVDRSVDGFEDYPLLACSELKGKPVFFIKDFPDELVLRKICRNIHRISRILYPNRDQLVSNIKNLVSEGVSYRIYRLDIKSFYESISPESALSILEDFPSLSIPTKRFIRQILTQHEIFGNDGLPRGIGLSAILSELVMKEFDGKMARMGGVYYYGRFVDDIIIITNKLEDEKNFVKNIKKDLPEGFVLNSNKQKIRSAIKDVSPFKAPKTTSLVLSFDYLGYEFLVYEPQEDSKKRPGMHFRDVWLDIADSKVKKIKSRIVMALLAFVKDGNYLLLEARLKYLTCNFSVLDVDRDRKRLAGIYHNYWQVDAARSKALGSLDFFLRKAIISANGPVFDKFYLMSNDEQRRKLLSNSFVRGFNKKPYMYFPKERIVEIQECWKYV